MRKDSIRYGSEFDLAFDMIVLDDSGAPVEPGTVQQVLAQLNVRRTLFVNAKLDVTDMLIQRMNAEFKAKQAGK